MAYSLAWTLDGADGQPIYGDTHLPETDAVGEIILCHGFKGYKDYGFFPLLAESAGRRGLVAHRFNFSHSGMTNHLETFERPDLFERDTWGRQIHDLSVVAHAAAGGELPGGEAERPITWFGHSRGGVTAVLTAARAFTDDPPPAEPCLPPSKLVLAATPHFAMRLDEQAKQLLREQGYLESPSSRTGQVLRVGRAWLQEYEADPDAFDPLQAAARVRCPTLVIHGGDDPTVPAASAHELAAALGEHATLQIVDGASHTFDSPNPLAEDKVPPATRQFIEAVCAFAAGQ